MVIGKLKRQSTTFNGPVSVAQVCCPLSYFPYLSFEKGKEYAINLIQSEFSRNAQFGWI